MPNKKSTAEKIQRGNFTPSYEQISEATDGLPGDAQMLYAGEFICGEADQGCADSGPGPLNTRASKTNSRLRRNTGN